MSEGLMDNMQIWNPGNWLDSNLNYCTISHIAIQIRYITIEIIYYLSNVKHCSKWIRWEMYEIIIEMYEDLFILISIEYFFHQY